MIHGRHPRGSANPETLMAGFCADCSGE